MRLIGAIGWAFERDNASFKEGAVALVTMLSRIAHEEKLSREQLLDWVGVAFDIDAARIAKRSAT